MLNSKPNTKFQRTIPFFATSALLLLSLAGCAPKASERLLGVWVMDSTEPSSTLPGPHRNFGRFLLSKSSLRVSFEKNGTFQSEFVLLDAKKQLAGTWEVISRDGATILSIRGPGSDSQIIDSLDLTFLSEDKFKVGTGQMDKISFWRSK